MKLVSQHHPAREASHPRATPVVRPEDPPEWLKPQCTGALGQIRFASAAPLPSSAPIELQPDVFGL